MARPRAPRLRAALAAIVVFAAVPALVEISSAQDSTGSTVMVSLDDEGFPSRHPSGAIGAGIDLSTGGRFVAFGSEGSLDADHPGPGVFLRDLVDGTIEKVSLAADGSNADGAMPSVSSDGRFVAFQTLEALVPEDNNFTFDVYVRDRQNQTTELISANTSGAAGNSTSRNPSIDAGGDVVAFSSFSNDLVDGDPPNIERVFVRDRSTGTTQRVSLSTEGDARSGSKPALSADGNVVAFVSSATDLVASDTNGHLDVFARDIGAGTTARASVATDGTETDAASGFDFPAISDDGTVVVFDSNATNLVSDDTNDTTDVFVRDLSAGTTVRASVDSDGTEGNDHSGNGGPRNGVGISADGSTVVFDSSATNLTTDDSNEAPDIFVHALADGVTERVSVSTGGGQGDGASGGASTSGAVIDGAGRHIAFVSHASDLVDNDWNGTTDVFVHDRDGQLDEPVASPPPPAQPVGSIERVSEADDGTQADGISHEPDVSGDGRFVAFTSLATNLVPDDTNGVSDVFVRDVVAGTTDRVSLAEDGTEMTTTSSRPAISADGRYVVFQSGGVIGEDPVAVYLRDREAAATTFLSFGSEPTINADGRYVAFETGIQHVAEDTDEDDVCSDSSGDVPCHDLYRLDLQTSEYTFVSQSSSGTHGDYHSWSPDISADGQVVVFTSASSNLSSDGQEQDCPSLAPQPSCADVYVRDIPAETTVRASRSERSCSPGNTCDQPASQSVVAATGEHLAFSSGARKDADHDDDGVFRFDRQTTDVELASYSDQQERTPWYSRDPAISANGDHVAFSTRTSFELADTRPCTFGFQDGNCPDIYMRDFQADELRRLTVPAAGVEADGGSFEPSVSDDSRTVAFTSEATNLVAGDSNDVQDVFVIFLDDGSEPTPTPDPSATPTPDPSTSPTPTPTDSPDPSTSPTPTPTDSPDPSTSPTPTPSGTPDPTRAPQTPTSTPRGSTVPGTPSSSSAAPGEEVSIAGDGYRPGSDARITFESTPVFLGTVRISSAGTFQTTVRIPSDATPGAHHIVVTGVAPDGRPRTTSFPITVLGQTTTSPVTLPLTGGPIAAMFWASVALLAIGATMIITRPRRSRQVSSRSE